MGGKRKTSDVGLNPKPKRKHKLKKQWPKSDPYPLDDFLLRHPSLSEVIFDQIDDTNLAKCRIVSKIWRHSIDDQRNTWIRMIRRKYIKSGMIKSHCGIFKKDWEKVFHRTPIEYVKELALTVQSQFWWDSLGKFGLKPLHFAAMTGNLNLYIFVNEKVEDKFPIKDQYTGGECKTPLDFASKNGHLEIVKYINQNIDIQDSYHPRVLHSLYFAAKYGHVEVYRSLEDHFQGQKFKENEKKDAIDKALWISALNGHLDVFKYILRNLEIKNTVKSDGWTPLHSAAKNGHLDICKFILSHDLSNYNPKSNSGETPLHKAAEFGHLEVFELLANYCSNINPRKKDGSTPLHKAAKNGHLQICRYILPNVMNKNPKGRRGETLLHTVAKLKIKSAYSKIRDKKIQFEVYKCIAESVKDKNPPDKLGITPLFIAANSKQPNKDICRYILEQLRDEYLSENREEFERLYYAGDLETTKQLFTSFCNNKNPTLYMQIKDAVGFVFRLDIDTSLSYNPIGPTYSSTRPILPQYFPTSPQYSPNSPQYIPTSPTYSPISASYYYPTYSPFAGPSDPAAIVSYLPRSPSYSPISPSYPTYSPFAGPLHPAAVVDYLPTSPTYSPISTSYPTYSPFDGPSNPAAVVGYSCTSPTYSQTSPAYYYPTYSPSVRPSDLAAAVGYSPTSPAYSPTSPSYYYPAYSPSVRPLYPDAAVGYSPTSPTYSSASPSYYYPTYSPSAGPSDPAAVVGYSITSPTYSPI